MLTGEEADDGLHAKDGAGEDGGQDHQHAGGHHLAQGGLGGDGNAPRVVGGAVAGGSLHKTGGLAKSKSKAHREARRSAEIAGNQVGKGDVLQVARRYKPQRLHPSQLRFFVSARSSPQNGKQTLALTKQRKKAGWSDCGMAHVG
eukprot:8693964-Pyramimonas_sp.AAC.2